MNNKFILIFTTLIYVSCNQEQKQSDNDISKNMSKVFDNYYEERLKLFPLEATAIADNRYNDQLRCDISDTYREKLIRAAHTCPVGLSLHPDIKQTIIFDFFGT